MLFVARPAGAHDEHSEHDVANDGDAPNASEEATVVVQGARSAPATASTTVVGSRELQAVPRRTADDGLRLVPGVTLVQHGTEGKGPQIFLRGFDAIHGADFEVTLEGIPLNEWSNVHAQGYLDLGIIIPEVVETIRVTKGPFTLDQGAFAMAGSADYHLGIAPEDQGTRLAYTLGTTNRHRGVMTHSFDGSEGHDFIASETVFDSGFGENRSFGRGVAMARRTLFSSERFGALSLLGAGQVARFELPTPLRNDDVEAGEIGFYDSYDDRTRGTSMRGISALSYELDRLDETFQATLFAGYRQLELLENFTGYLLDEDAGDRRLQKHETFSFGLTAAYRAALHERMTLVLGLGSVGDALTQSQQHVGPDEEFLGTERDLSGLQTRSHAFSGVEYRPITPLRIDAGARVDLIQVNVRDHISQSQGQETLVTVSPRSTVAWQVIEPAQLFLAYGRGIRPPELRSFSDFQPAQTGIAEEVHEGGEPRMTLTHSFEGGVRVRPHPRVSTSVTGFLTLIDSESIYDHVSGTNLELNSTRRIGTEAVVRARPTSWLLVVADATYVDARFVESGNVVPLAPWLLGGVRTVVTPSAGFRGGLRFFAVAPRSLPHGARGATWSQLDATVGRDFDTFRLDLEVENVLGQRLREGEFHFASSWRTGETSRLPTLHYFAGPPTNARLTFTALF